MMTTDGVGDISKELFSLSFDLSDPRRPLRIDGFHPSANYSQRYRLPLSCRVLGLNRRSILQCDDENNG